MTTTPAWTRIGHVDGGGPVMIAPMTREPFREVWCCNGGPPVICQDHTVERCRMFKSWGEST